MPTKNHVDTFAQGIRWLPKDSKFGISPKIQAEIESGEQYFEYPKPEGTLDKWVGNLTGEQLHQALCDYHNRWTWETGDPKDREILECIEAEQDKRDPPPTEGDAYFDTAESVVYIYASGYWHAMGASPTAD